MFLCQAGSADAGRIGGAAGGRARDALGAFSAAYPTAREGPCGQGTSTMVCRLERGKSEEREGEGKPVPVAGPRRRSRPKWGCESRPGESASPGPGPEATKALGPHTARITDTHAHTLTVTA